MSPTDSIRELFSRSEFSWLIDRLVSRIERGLSLDSGKAGLSDPDAVQRRAIDDLLGRRSSRGKSIAVDLAALVAKTGLNARELRQVVEEIRGPVENRSALREAEAEAWDTLFARWETRLRDRPELLEWLEELRRTGQLKKVGSGSAAEAEILLEQVMAILAAAPHDDILLASLAAYSTGDSHALDRGRPLAHLCLRAIARLQGIDGTGDADSRREAWAEIGVVVDDLSAPALCLNVRPAPGSDLAPWIDWHVERGEPYFLTWRQVRNFLPDAENSGPVHVCENPAVVSEAGRRLGAKSRPLICLNGVPSGAVRKLLGSLLDAGFRLKMRADFDWAGLRILDRWMAFDNVSAWRMSRDDYRTCRPVKSLQGVPCRPDWASGLVEAMDETGCAAFEEELMESLLKDLVGK